MTGYQTTVNLPYSIVSAAAALGNSSISGTATAQVDASGATPGDISVGPLDITVPIPSPVPMSGVALSLPGTAQTVGPFYATSSVVTIQEDSAASLTLDVSGANLTLTCSAYPNDSVATGIVTSAPSGSPIAPVIAVAGGGSSTTTAPPAVTTTTITVVATTTTSPVESTTTPTTTAAITTTTAPATSTTTTTPPGGSTITSSTALPSSTTTPTATAATSASTTSTTPCYRDSEGNCYRSGEFCPDALRSQTVEGENGPIICTQNDGLRWEPAVSGTGGTTNTISNAVRAASSSLAFTGSGPGLKTMTLVGAGVVLLGLVLLFLVDMPRRVLRQLADLSPGRRRDRASGGTRAMATAIGREVARRISWLLGR